MARSRDRSGGHGGSRSRVTTVARALDMGAYLDDQKDKVGLKFEGQMWMVTTPREQRLNQAEKALKSVYRCRSVSVATMAVMPSS